MGREPFISTRGAWDTRHWIGVPALSHEADGQHLQEYLGRVPGVRVVECEPGKQRVRITYDQTRIDYHALLREMEDLGFPASDGWWSRQKGSWFQFLDRNARENANAPESPCCSNPRGIAGKRGRR